MRTPRKRQPMSTRRPKTGGRDGLEVALVGADSIETMRARARELREQAKNSDVGGFRDAALTLAGRYKETAAGLAR
jgi:hypothetical protein